MIDNFIEKGIVNTFNLITGKSTYDEIGCLAVYWSPPKYESGQPVPAGGSIFRHIDGQPPNGRGPSRRPISWGGGVNPMGVYVRLVRD